LRGTNRVATRMQWLDKLSNDTNISWHAQRYVIIIIIVSIIILL